MNKAVIFDMDGVICHTNPYHSIAFKEFFAKRELFPTEAEFALHMYGKSNSYILSHFLGRKIEGQELLELEDEKESLFREIYREKVDPIAGFMQFFQSLKQQGLPTGVATSAPFANLELIAGTLGIMHQMQSILPLNMSAITSHTQRYTSSLPQSSKWSPSFAWCLRIPFQGSRQPKTRG